MLSFTLSGKHLSYAYTHLTHKTITGNINFMHLYYELIQVLLHITGLCSYGTPVGVTDLILYRAYTYNRLTFIRDSHRSYRTYPYSALILIQNLYLTDLCLFRTPVGVTELMLMLRSLNLFGGTRRYHRDHGTCTGIAELILTLSIREYP